MRSAIFIFLATMLLSTSVNGHSAAYACYINYKYKSVLSETTLPNGVKHAGGGLIGDINADPVYGISQVSKGEVRMLWLEVSTGHDADGSVTGWQVIDVLSFPALSKSDYFFFAGDPSIDCRRNGVEL